MLPKTNRVQLDFLYSSSFVFASSFLLSPSHFRSLSLHTPFVSCATWRRKKPVIFSDICPLGQQDVRSKRKESVKKWHLVCRRCRLFFTFYLNMRVCAYVCVCTFANVNILFCLSKQGFCSIVEQSTIPFYVHCCPMAMIFAKWRNSL